MDGRRSGRGTLVELFVIGAAVGSLIVNAVFQIEGGAGLGLTYVTGALVKVGQLAAEALRGGARWGWAPNLLLWAALVAGSLCGAAAYHWINLAAIWFAAAAAAGAERGRGRDNSSLANSSLALTAKPACLI
jgi:uncharacterized membrane protein YoaK (UPF0700 family)